MRMGGMQGVLDKGTMCCCFLFGCLFFCFVFFSFLQDTYIWLSKMLSTNGEKRRKA